MSLYLFTYSLIQKSFAPWRACWEVDWFLANNSPLKIENNKLETAQIGAISKAQQIMGHFGEKSKKLRKNENVISEF